MQDSDNPTPFKALAQHYADAGQVAAYLEAEWSDILLGGAESRAAGQHFGPVTPAFYERVAREIVEWAAHAGVRVRDACDIGGATGRLVHELARRVDGIERVTLVEPAPQLAAWARKLLLGEGVVDAVPVVQTRVRTGFAAPAGLPVATGARLAVVEGGVDEFDPGRQFDLVCCLNVADRVPRPMALVDALARHLRPGGMLVLSSPLSFDLRFTPDRADWIDDLCDLLPDERWRIAGQADVQYDIRRAERERIGYMSQVVAAVKR